MSSHETRFQKSGLVVRGMDEGKPVISGVGIAYNKRSQDLGGFTEVILPEATRKTLSDGAAGVYASFNHNPDMILGRVSARTLSLRSDADGLHYEIDPPMASPTGQHVFSAIQRGDVTGSSFTFRSIADDWSEDTDGRLLRSVSELALYELGPVVSPAYLDSSSSARSAYKSLAASRGIDLEEVTRCAKEGHLADIVRAAVPDLSDPESPGTTDVRATDEPGDHSDAAKLHLMRLRLELMKRSNRL